MLLKLSQNTTLKLEQDEIVFTQGLAAGYYAGLMMLGLPVLFLFIYSLVSHEWDLTLTTLGIISIATSIGGFYKEITINKKSKQIFIKWLLYKKYTLYTIHSKSPLGTLTLAQSGARDEVSYYLMNNNEVLIKLNSHDTFNDLKKHIVINGEYIEVRQKNTGNTIL